MSTYTPAPLVLTPGVRRRAGLVTAAGPRACQGNSFLQLRDQALVRMYYNTGARLTEIGCLLVSDLDLDTNSVVLHGKGRKDRRVRFGPKTARVLTRYLRVRGRRAGIAAGGALDLGKGIRPVKSNGIKIRSNASGKGRPHRRVCAPVAAQLRP